MSDLRSEMVTKVLSQWDAPNMNNIVDTKTFGERVFEWVKDHPYSSVQEVERGLGVGKEASVSSFLKSQLDRGILGREQKLKVPYPGIGSRHFYVYYHTSEKYKSHQTPKKMGRPKKVVIKQVDLLKNVQEHRLPERMKQVANEFNPEIFVQELSLKDAKAVFELLKGYFG